MRSTALNRTSRSDLPAGQGPRSWRAAAVALTMVLSGLAPVALTAAPAHAALSTLEGEAPATSNFKINSTPATPTNESGVAVWKLDTAETAPTQGYSAKYAVTAYAAGLYRIDFIGSAIADSNSSFALLVDGVEIFNSVGSARDFSGQTANTLFRYQLPVVHLSAGAHEYEFRVTEKRQSDNARYTFYIDKFTVQDTALGHVAASPKITNVSAGTQVSLSSPYAVGARIFYTTDNTDPTSSSTRLLYTTPISITANTKLRARAEVAGVYSPNDSVYDYSVAAVSPLVVEGESPSASNFRTGNFASYPTTHHLPTPTTSPANVAAVASGGKVWRVETPTAAPSGGYVAEYKVVAPTAGQYFLDLVSTPLDVSWASDEIEIGVNANPTLKVDRTSVTKNESYGPLLVRNSMKTLVQLNAGENTLRVLVNKRNTYTNNYVFYLDSLQFRSLEVGPVVAAPASGKTVPIGSAVTLSATPSSAEIRYTKDGSDPATSNTATVYSGPIPVVQSALTIKAYAQYSGLAGVTSTFSYIGKVEAASASPVGGAMDPVPAGTSVTLSAEQGSTVFFTQDGSDPKTSATRTQYTGPITINAAKTVKTVSQREGVYSEVATYVYKTTSSLVIMVEGESVAASDTNFLPTTLTGTLAKTSGGKYLRLETTTAPPAGGYFATYHVQAPEAGVYQLDLFATPAENASFSPFKISANGSDPVDVRVADRYDSAVISPIIRQHAASFHLNQGPNEITFRVTEPRQNAPAAQVFFLDAFRLTKSALKVAKLIGDKPYNVFETGDHAVNFKLSLNAEADQNYTSHYVVTDYFGDEVAEGDVTIQSGQRAVNIPLGDLPVGHYTIETALDGLDGGDIRDFFAVLRSTAERDRTVDDSPFAIDTASSWYVNPPYSKADYARILALSGTSWARERFGWTVPQPEEGATPNFAPYDPTIDSLSAAGVKILNTLSDAPRWSRATAEDQLPVDLFDIYNYSKSSAEHYGDKVAAWEIWNEEEAHETGNNETADQYAAFMKASALGYKDADLDESDRPYVSMGGFIGNVHKYGDYQDLAMKNDILRYSDIYNFHNHQIDYDEDLRLNPLKYEMSELHLEQRDRYDTQSTPAWTTESGLGVRVAPNAEYSATQMGDQARFLVTAALENLALGADKHFFFIGSNFQERDVNWSMFSWGMKPRASFAAQAVLTEALGHADYAGTAKNLPSNVKGYVFEDGTDTVLALWSPVSQTIDLSLDHPDALLTNIMGAKEEIEANAGSFSVDVGVDPIYVRVAGAIPSSSYTASDLPERELVRKELSSADHIVIAQRYDDAARLDSKKNNAYTMKLGESNTVAIEVYNFSDAPMSGSITGQAEAGSGWTVSAPQSVTIPAKQKVTLTYSLVPGSSTAIDGEPVMLTFQGDFDGAQTSRSVSYIRFEDAIGMVASVNDQDQQSLSLTVKNPTAGALEIDRVDWTWNGVSGSETSLAIPVAAAATAKVEVAPLPASDWYTDYPVEVTVHFTSGLVVTGEGELALNLVPKEATVVDGEADTVDPAMTVDLATQANLVLSAVDGYHGGNSDLSGKFWLKWDDDNVYLTATLTDDVHSQDYSGSEIWMGDGLQFALAQGPTGSKQRWYEFGAALTPSGPQVYRWSAGDGRAAATVAAATVAVTREESSKSTVYEVAIPWSELPPLTSSDELASFSLMAVDNDGAGREGWYEWGAGIGSSKDAALFRTIQFYSNAEPPAVVTGPSAPANLSADEVTRSSIALSWTSSVPEGVRYQVFQDEEMLAEVGDATYTVTDLDSGAEHVYTVRSVDSRGRVSDRTSPLTIATLYGDPPTPGALSSTFGQTGIRDGRFTIAYDLWWGVPAESIEMFINGDSLGASGLDSSSGHQRATRTLDGLANGTYTVTCKLKNPGGTSMCGSITVEVSDAAPGTPVVSDDNWDADGNFTLAANMWWGTNATQYRLLQNGTEIASGPLTASTPSAQAVSRSLSGLAPGSYNFTFEFVGPFGATSSQPHTVNVVY